ncbi:MAG: DegT/DnrJ/EryC1/StrS aminotransferase family protein, partial [Crocinitomicaceae bacterium]
MIPFSPPRIDQKVIDEVTAALKSGWITTGPRTKLFEKNLTEYCGCKITVAVNSWTMGMQVLLHWWGIGPGDEVILPAYTYCASINVIIHAGATPVMVDVSAEDFNISSEKIKAAITDKTKAIIAVDIAGFPCDYDEIYKVIEDAKPRFQGNNDLQKQLGRILLISDAAHSFGATMNGKVSGALADISCFSFHAVKNLTTAEGGAICFNLPTEYDHEEIYRLFNTMVLHGQSKDALAKTQKGNWRYDVEEPGFKCNMTDLQAAIGLVELERYQENLDRRKQIFKSYTEKLGKFDWAITPKYINAAKETSYHLYLFRIKGITEAQRDEIMRLIFDQDVSVNVHFQPLPLLTAYKKRGFKMKDYPETWNKYSNEISL